MSADTVCGPCSVATHRGLERRILVFGEFHATGRCDPRQCDVVDFIGNIVGQNQCQVDLMFEFLRKAEADDEHENGREIFDEFMSRRQENPLDRLFAKFHSGIYTGGASVDTNPRVRLHPIDIRRPVFVPTLPDVDLVSGCLEKERKLLHLEEPKFRECIGDVMKVISILMNRSEAGIRPALDLFLTESGKYLDKVGVGWSPHLRKIKRAYCKIIACPNFFRGSPSYDRDMPFEQTIRDLTDSYSASLGNNSLEKWLEDQEAKSWDDRQFRFPSIVEEALDYLSNTIVNDLVNLYTVLRIFRKTYQERRDSDLCIVYVGNGHAKKLNAMFAEMGMESRNQQDRCTQQCDNWVPVTGVKRALSLS